MTRVLVGITIGLLGGGGAILAVPIFIYVISPMEVAAIEDIAWRFEVAEGGRKPQTSPFSAHFADSR